MLGPICQNAAYMSDETLEREADACVAFDYPAMDRDFQRNKGLCLGKKNEKCLTNG